jgi:hypothetical protein
MFSRLVIIALLVGTGAAHAAPLEYTTTTGLVVTVDVPATWSEVGPRNGHMLRLHNAAYAQDPAAQPNGVLMHDPAPGSAEITIVFDTPAGLAERLATDFPDRSPTTIGRHQGEEAERTFGTGEHIMREYLTVDGVGVMATLTEWGGADDAREIFRRTCASLAVMNK